MTEIEKDLKEAMNWLSALNINSEWEASNKEILLSTIEKQQRELNIKNEYLQLIHDIGFDYDGCNTVDSLKKLIDELIGLVNKAYKCDDKTAMYIGGGKEVTKKFNILHEEIEEVGNDE